ncbi:YlbF family regulator [Enterococcus sp. 2201sp1_2201st1_B8_2201SCRN_220225]|uniref:YlbF family regulator n=1 Tax=unclassified Enterococcus TaxID=2608891 RepID=UPI0034A1BFCD
MKAILENEEAIKQAVEQLDRLLCDLPQVKEFQNVAAKVRNNEGLAQLEAEIKEAQKAVVNFGHYGKEEAQKQALEQVKLLTAAYDQHPLVVAYRQQLIEINDLLEYVTGRLQRGVEELLE